MLPFLQTQGVEYEKAVIHLVSVPEFEPSFYARNSPDLKGPLYVPYHPWYFKMILSSFKNRDHYLYSYDQKKKSGILLPVSE